MPSAVSPGPSAARSARENEWRIWNGLAYVATIPDRWTLNRYPEKGPALVPLRQLGSAFPERRNPRRGSTEAAAFTEQSLPSTSSSAVRGDQLYGLAKNEQYGYPTSRAQMEAAAKRLAFHVTVPLVKGAGIVARLGSGLDLSPENVVVDFTNPDGPTVWLVDPKSVEPEEMWKGLDETMSLITSYLARPLLPQMAARVQRDNVRVACGRVGEILFVFGDKLEDACLFPEALYRKALPNNTDRPDLSFFRCTAFVPTPGPAVEVLLSDTARKVCCTKYALPAYAGPSGDEHLLCITCPQRSVEDETSQGLDSMLRYKQASTLAMARWLGHDAAFQKLAPPMSALADLMSASERAGRHSGERGSTLAWTPPQLRQS